MKISSSEDDKTVGQYVQRGLTEARYTADLATDGEEGCATRQRATTTSSCSTSGCRRSADWSPGTLRDRGFTEPILVLNGAGERRHQSQVLRTGADDYVTKPFAFEELLARVEALGRRPKAIARPSSPRRLGARHRQPRSTARRRLVELTPKEYAVLSTCCATMGG